MKLIRHFSPFAFALAAVTATAFVNAAPMEDSSALASMDGDGYTVVVNDGSGSVGATAFVTVTIQAKAKEGFKVNDKYPHKISLGDAPDGVELPKKVLKKDDGKFEGKSKFTFEIPVKAIKKGSYNISGKLKFSVCNASQCLIEKKDVKAKLTAS